MLSSRLGLVGALGETDDWLGLRYDLYLKPAMIASSSAIPVVPVSPVKELLKLLRRVAKLRDETEIGP